MQQRMRFGGPGIALAAVLSIVPPAVADEHADARAAMVREIESMSADTGSVTGRDRLGQAVLEVMGRVPRHLFAPGYSPREAYANRPLRIGHGQTISQPYIVALMTDLLALERDDAVLEIGTGSAYQAAVLAELVERVHTIEIVKPLARDASRRLRELGYDGVETRHGDGYFGWPEAAPFDAIIVTAAAGHVPPPLVEQLAPGGVMVIPVGGRFAVQQLLLVRKLEDGTVRTRQVLPVRFVPLTGGG